MAFGRIAPAAWCALEPPGGLEAPTIGDLNDQQRQSQNL
jgi:hypothetical protein